MNVYLAGPVAGQSDEIKFEWRDAIKEAVFRRYARGHDEIRLIDPTEGLERCGTWEGDRTIPLEYMLNPRFVYDKSMKHVCDADVIIVRIFDGIRSTGTDMEVSLGMYLDKPIIVWKDAPGSPIHPFYEANAAMIVCDPAAAAEVLERF